MQKIVEITTSKLDLPYISWKMTNWCNYHCPYCCSHANSSLWIPEDTIYKQAIQINSLIEKLGVNIKLCLVGGEVTYYDLSYLLDNYLISDKIIELNIVTNLSQPLEYFLSLKKVCEKRNIYLALRASVHLSEVKDIDEFIYKAEYLQCKVSLVLSNTNCNEVYNYLQKVKDYNINELSLVFDQYIKQRTPEMLEIYDYYLKNFTKSKNYPKPYKVLFDNGETKEFTRSELTKLAYNFKGYKCMGNIRINYDGLIYCGACFSKKQKKLNFNELMSLTNDEIKNKLVVSCDQDICTICGVGHIWR